jgi:ATP-dependent helicase HepA
MSDRFELPRARGQLVWSPADPSLGVGVVTQTDGSRITVRFMRLQEERAYTTRGVEHVIVRYEIGRGERVRDRDGLERRVEKPLATTPEGLIIYELEGGKEALESELVPEIRDVGPKERLATLSLVHPEVVRSRMRGLDLGRFSKRPGTAAILGARVLWLPHQIDVATRALSCDRVRLLLADEVGLGKTVEATLIYAGLRSLGRASRVLILTPDSLCIQWLGEIYRKAHELLVLLDEERIEDALRDFPDLSPFEAHQRLVASVDRIARDESLAVQIRESRWDLVIVDEAHHLRWRREDGGNPAYRLVEALAQHSRHLLLLTATPMALDPAEYHALLRLLDPTRFDDPGDFAAATERAARIREVGQKLAQAVLEHKPVSRAVAKRAGELFADDALDTQALKQFLAKKPLARDRSAAAQDILALLRERHALADYVIRNRRGPVGGLPERHAEVQPLDATPMQDMLLEIGEGVIYDLARTIDERHERYKSLGELLRALWATPRALVDILEPFSPELVRELLPFIMRVSEAPLDKEALPTGDARLRWLVGVIWRVPPQEKLLVFVESAIAARALRASLEPSLGGDIAVFHRGLSPRDQDRQVAWFRDPQGPAVMLSTEAGGEGRNFQFCHEVVLYDLPWRPATVEQRIGRVDRVGQMRDVRVLVPYFRGGHEAAILKIMQESIGVLDRTVGGIDHALEYVSDRIAALILEGAGADAWKSLYRDTQKLVSDARRRVSEEVDPILDHASFSAERARTVIAEVPDDLEARTEQFVQSYADHSRLQLRAKGGPLYSVEGAPGAAGREDSDTGFVATFSRVHALDHEDVEFLSFGHPLVEQAEEWAREAHAQSAALAICRGFPKDGAAFLWRFELDLPDDVPEAATFFESHDFTFAIDEGGKRVKELEDLLSSSARPLDRMDPSPLRGSYERWRRLVESNYGEAEKLATAAIAESVAQAQARLEETLSRRQRHLARAQARELASLGPRSRARQAVSGRQELERAQLGQERERLATAIANTRPRLIAAVAVRLMRAREVSA